MAIDQRVYGRAGQPCRRCGTRDPQPRAVGGQPAHLLVPGVPALMRRASATRAPTRSCRATPRASFDAALRCGVDMIEFDVLPEPGTGRLVLAHDPDDAASAAGRDARGGAGAPRRRADVELDVDLKAPGYELAVLEALRDHGLVERTLVSSQYRASLALLRGAEPGAAPRLVGAEAPPRPVPLPRERGAGDGGAARLPRGAARDGRRRPSARARSMR